MKSKFSLTLFVIVFTACQRDKDCVPPPLAEQLVNSWDATLVSEKDKIQELTFKSDGSFNESKGVLFGAAGNPVCNWEVENDSVVLIGTFSNGNIERYECGVVSRTCDQIVLDLQGVDQIELKIK